MASYFLNLPPQSFKTNKSSIFNHFKISDNSRSNGDNVKVENITYRRPKIREFIHFQENIHQFSRHDQSYKDSLLYVSQLDHVHEEDNYLEDKHYFIISILNIPAPTSISTFPKTPTYTTSNYKSSNSSLNKSYGSLNNNSSGYSNNINSSNINGGILNVHKIATIKKG
ncbi:hypothetical protein ACTFIV_008617 [Dictyostelium citrinum]